MQSGLERRRIDRVGLVGKLCGDLGLMLSLASTALRQLKTVQTASPVPVELACNQDLNLASTRDFLRQSLPFHALRGRCRLRAAPNTSRPPTSHKVMITPMGDYAEPSYWLPYQLNLYLSAICS